MSSSPCSLLCQIGWMEVITASLVHCSGFQAEQKLGHRDMLWRSIKYCILGGADNTVVVVVYIIQSRWDFLSFEKGTHTHNSLEIDDRSY